MRRVYSFCQNYLTYAIVISVLSMQVHAQTPKLKGSDLVINGESFFAASNIASELTRLARADGVLPSNESFKQIAVSGSNISQILGFYKNCNPKPKYLLSDGGGIDLMGSCGGTPTADCSIIKNCKVTLQQYIDEMKKGGTRKFMWMCYPDPQGANWATLKANQDIWAVEAKKIVLASEDPKCQWIDLRPVWQGHYSQYTSDGIHCTNTGGTATAEAFWKAMKENNFAFFDTNFTAVKHEPFGLGKAVPLSIQSQLVGHDKLAVSLSVDKPSNILLNLVTISGRSVLTVERKISFVGLQTVLFPLDELTNGIYLCKIQTGQLRSQSKLILSR
jgi:hypothetical protein